MDHRARMGSHVVESREFSDAKRFGRDIERGESACTGEETGDRAAYSGDSESGELKAVWRMLQRLRKRPSYRSSITQTKE